MLGFRLVVRAAIAAVITVVLLSSVAAKAQGVCNFLSGSQKTACHNAAVALANKKAADAQKAKAAESQPVTAATPAAPGVGNGTATAAAPQSAVLVPVAQQTTSARTQTCSGLQVNLVSLVRTGPGDVTASFLLLNTKNDDMATFVYYGGANGKNTFLVDDSGTEWPKKRVDGNGNHRQPLIAGVNTKYQLIFHVATGGQDARTFQVITYFQLLPLSGMGEFGWCNIKFANVPLSAAPEAQAPPPAQPASPVSTQQQATADLDKKAKAAADLLASQQAAAAAAKARAAAQAAEAARIAALPPAGPVYSRQMAEYVQADARGWAMNQLDAGSVGKVRVNSGSIKSGNFVLRAEYSYNGGSQGWVMALFSSGKFQCVQFWDSMIGCRPIRKPGEGQQRAGAIFDLLNNSGGSGSTGSDMSENARFEGWKRQNDADYNQYWK